MSPSSPLRRARVLAGVLLTLGLAVTTLVYAPVGAAGDAHLLISGVNSDAPGGVFEIEDFSFDTEQTLNIGSASGGAGAGRVKFSSFSVTKVVDKASPVFFQAAATGRHFSTVTLTKGADTYVFTDVALSHYTTSKRGDQPTETMTFNFTKMTQTSGAQPTPTPNRVLPAESRALTVPGVSPPPK